MGPQSLCGPQQVIVFTKTQNRSIQRELGQAGNTSVDSLGIHGAWLSLSMRQEEGGSLEKAEHGHPREKQ